MPEKEVEVSLRELILKCNKAVSFLLVRWKVFLIIGFLGGVVGVMYAFSKKPIYNAYLSFVLSGESKSSNGLMGLASQFGVDIGGSGGSDLFSGDNITSLMVSEKMLKLALFKKPDQGNDLLINILAKELKLDKAWKENPHLSGCYPFPDAKQLTLTQDSIVREFCALLNKGSIAVGKPDKKQSIFLVKVTSTNEAFSLYLAKYLVEETANFYISTKTKVAKQNLFIIQHEADSLRGILAGSIAATAKKVDETFNLNAAYQVKRSGAQQGQSQTAVIGAAYGEVVKNLEIAKLTLQKETPLFQLIDEPRFPLKRERIGRIKTGIAGAFISVFLGAIVLIGITLYKNAMKND